ncbi:hypothetical protein SAMN02745866_00363 [Alteromonadaceae bacterium Bs31]|nr:hypothetical protein SAMN02745866_00363 [Alteromonadaceae bacterium Bs31]
MGEMSYKVVSSGEYLNGYDPEWVQAEFAKLFKLPATKAKLALNGERVLKKGLSSEKAEAYKNRLNGIGLAVSVELEAASPALSLSLEPLSTELAEADSKQQAVTDSTPFLCPKCNLEQLRSEQCTGCGVYFNKLEAPQAFDEPPSGDKEMVTEGAMLNKGPETEPAVEADADDFAAQVDIKAVAAAAGAAVVGALLWKLIAVSFDYEIGLIAILIGAMVGFASAMLGARGEVAAVICCVLTIFSIVGGKYLTYSAFQSEWEQTMGTLYEADEMQAFYQQEQDLARVYIASVSDDQSLREFMLDGEYSEAENELAIAPDEIADFKENVEPYLRELASGDMSFVEWKESTFGAVQNLSTWELLRDSFGFIDLLFIVIGVSAAYRVGRGDNS